MRTSRSSSVVRPKSWRSASMMCAGLSGIRKPIFSSARSRCCEHPFDLHHRRGRSPIRFRRRDSRRTTQLVATDQHRLRQIQRRVLGIGVDADQALAVLQVFVGQTVVLGTEQQRDRPAPRRRDHRGCRRHQIVRGRTVRAPATRRPHHQMTVRDGVCDRRDGTRAAEHVVRMHRHGARHHCAAGARRDQEQVAQSQVLHRTRNGADVGGAPRAHENDTNLGERIVCSPPRCDDASTKRRRTWPQSACTLLPDLKKEGLSTRSVTAWAIPRSRRRSHPDGGPIVGCAPVPSTG